nr:gtpase-activating protein gyp5 [Quercus suber]
MADTATDVKTTDDDTVKESQDTFEDAPDTQVDMQTEAEKEKSSTSKAIDVDDPKMEEVAVVESDNEIPKAEGDHDVSNLSQSSESTAEPGQVDTKVVDAELEADRSRPGLTPPDQPRSRSVSPSKARYRPQSPTKPLQGLTGELPVVNTLPPPSTSERLQSLEAKNIGERPNTPSAMPPPPGGLARKASSGFVGLLGRMGRKSAPSPPATKGDALGLQRRDTQSSLESNGTLTTIMDGPEGKPIARVSLRDQFQHLRHQEEHHGFEPGGTIFNNEDGDDMEKTPTKREFTRSSLSNPTSPTSNNQEPMSPLRSPPPDPKLPPGTALGMSAGPSDEPRSVNWDFWQSVVYEGPAAVTRTSGEALNASIASGIPPAIRGVVWQVLAESKSEELESMYLTLKTRGKDGEKPDPPSRSVSRADTNGTDAVSSGSSEHSRPSTPERSSRASVSASVDGNEAHLQTKLLAEKQKREAASLARLEKAIKRDLGSRTSFSKYTQSAGLQDGLFGVCKAYALFDEGVGYAQGINFIAMPLLFNVSEEEAFTLLVRLMSKYDLRSLFTAEMTGLHLRLYQFERLLEDHEPALYCHLKRRHVTATLYATQWFLTLFAYRFPLQLVLRVYDLIFSEGLTAVLKFGLVLVQRNRETLLGMKDMSQLTTFLKEKIFDVYIDKSPSASSLLDSGFFGSVTGGADKELYRADEMVRDACDVHISDEVLASYTAEWEETSRLAIERENELENLRMNNVTLTHRVRLLEEETQQRDTEHVTIAGDLVRLKVENDHLGDENESMKVKIEELRNMVDKQPAEVEAKLKDEMERIMQRNIEVQNENRAMREEMDEVESELVNVKMKHAQVSFQVLPLIWNQSEITVTTDTLRPRLTEAKMGKRPSTAKRQVKPLMNESTTPMISSSISNGHGGRVYEKRDNVYT